MLIGQHLKIDCTQIVKFPFKDKNCQLSQLFFFMLDILCSWFFRFHWVLPSYKYQPTEPVLRWTWQIHTTTYAPIQTEGSTHWQDIGGTVDYPECLWCSGDKFVTTELKSFTDSHSSLLLLRLVPKGNCFLYRSHKVLKAQKTNSHIFLCPKHPHEAWWWKAFLHLPETLPTFFEKWFVNEREVAKVM